MIPWLLLNPPMVWPWTLVLLVAAPLLGWVLWTVTRWYDDRVQERVFRRQVDTLTDQPVP